MALTYKNRRTGRQAKVLEPGELAEHLATVRRRGRPLDEKRILLAKKRRERLIVKMNDSWKWQRVDGGQPAGNGDRPADADVRAWAATEGIEVPARGKLAPEVVERYKAAHGG